MCLGITTCLLVPIFTNTCVFIYPYIIKNKITVKVMLVYCFWPTILPQSRKTGLGREVVTRRCPKCGHHKRLTKHHVYPVRWKGDWDQTQSQTTVALCAECHAGIERVIELFELRGSQYLRGPMAAEFYPAVLEWYLDQEVTSAVIDCIWGVRPKRD